MKKESKKIIKKDQRTEKVIIKKVFSRGEI